MRTKGTDPLCLEQEPIVDTSELNPTQYLLDQKGNYIATISNHQK
jgi:hypothetical protein